MKPKPPRRAIAMTAAVRRQTTEEKRRFEAALELLLTQIVRQEIAGREECSNGKEDTTG